MPILLWQSLQTLDSSSDKVYLFHVSFQLKTFTAL